MFGLSQIGAEVIERAISCPKWRASVNGVSEESNGVPTSLRYVRERLLEAAWGLPSVVSWDEAVEVSFTACS